MSSQIFKFHIPIDMFINFLNNLCNKSDNTYIINSGVYKRGLYNDIIPNFINEIKTYYYISKRKYLERKLTYNSFITVIRQICNLHNFTYTSQIKYDKSKYEIIYYITKPVSQNSLEA